MSFSAAEEVWVLDRDRWYRGVVEGVVGNTEFDKSVRYSVRWWNGGGFGVRHGTRTESGIMRLDDPAASGFSGE